MSELNEEDLLSKHKKERKDLQSQIQALKKSCGKGDKKKKKEVAEQIVQLEQELDERQEKELEELKQNSTSIPQSSVIQSSNDENVDIKINGEESEEQEQEQKEARVSKAQKRRNKKTAENKERELRIRVQDEENRTGPRVIETDKINEILKSLGLKIFSVPADGNCLYGAVNHQLKITDRKEYSISQLRKLTAKYMREHKDDILPFMSYDIDDLEGVYTEEQYEKYCNKVANTTEWGGQIEILALSNALKCPIKIIQASSAPTVQGEHFEGTPLVISYHRHLYRLGEHYNSTAPI